MNRPLPGRRRRVLLVASALGVAALCWGGYVGHGYLQLALAYSAKVAGSAVFVSGRSLDAVREEELDRFGFVELRVEGDWAVAAAFGFERRALHRPGLGVTLADTTLLPAEFIAPRPAAPIDDEPSTLPAPTGLARAIDRSFAWTSERSLRTLAVVVRLDGRIVAERYADGFGRDSRLPGWSMAKGITAALTGVLVRQGRLRLDQPAPVREWGDPGDPRAAITVEHLLRADTGLWFDETYTAPGADAARMLFFEADMAGFAARQPLVHPPGSTFAYSSGTANLLARVLRDTLGGDAIGFLRFAHAELLGPIGMSSAVLEVDASGSFVGSSFALATARGWSRFGQLHLDDGVWRGHRILPDGWVEEATTPAASAGDGEFGFQVWLNRGAPGGGEAPMPDLPSDTFAFEGHGGQIVAVVPSRRAVIVRLAADREGTAADRHAFVRRVLDALPD